MVWRGGRLQRDGNGAAWPQSGGPFQLLLPEVQPEDRPAPGRPNGTRLNPHVQMKGLTLLSDKISLCEINLFTNRIQRRKKDL